MVSEVRDQHDTKWAAMRAVSELLGVGTTETVRKWVRQAEIDAGSRPGVSTEESAELKRLKRENAELKRYSADGVGFLRVELDPATSLIVRFISEHQGRRDRDGLRDPRHPESRISDAMERIRSHLRFVAADLRLIAVTGTNSDAAQRDPASVLRASVTPVTDLLRSTPRAARMCPFSR